MINVVSAGTRRLNEGDHDSGSWIQIQAATCIIGLIRGML
jgi:hypothetical protein